jgi:2-oxoglutarate ferredoxin oxidoreductase subunit alpha
MTVEINYSDAAQAPLITNETRRYAQLAWVLRAHTLMDIDCWSVVYGHPLQPGMIHNVILKRLASLRSDGAKAAGEANSESGEH